jgi:hypothetical protein
LAATGAFGAAALADFADLAAGLAAFDAVGFACACAGAGDTSNAAARPRHAAAAAQVGRTGDLDAARRPAS